MNTKKYIVRLSQEERTTLEDVIKKLAGTSQKVRRAQILLKADANGSNWTDAQIADAYACRDRTVENVRKELINSGFDIALNGNKKGKPPKKSLDGTQEAKLIAMRLGSPPKGFGSWSLRLLAEQAVELEIVESISHETVRTTLKKMESQEKRFNIGLFLQSKTLNLWHAWKIYLTHTQPLITSYSPSSVWTSNLFNW